MIKMNAGTTEPSNKDNYSIIWPSSHIMSQSLLKLFWVRRIKEGTRLIECRVSNPDLGTYKCVERALKVIIRRKLKNYD